PKIAVGLRRESVSVVGLQKQGRSFALRRAATIDLPEGVLSPNFVEPNIIAHEELTAALREAASNAGLGGQKKWSASLPIDAARAAILTLEVAPKTGKELNEVLNWKAERNFGTPASEMRLTFQKLAPDAEKRFRYFAVAVKQDILDEYEELFNGLGWRIGLILPRHVSEANWLTRAQTSKTNGDSLLISTQSEGFTAILMRQNVPFVVRSVVCEPDECEDELFRLLLFYRDRLEAEKSASIKLLDRFLLVGEGFEQERLTEIAQETLGYDLPILAPEDVGLLLPDEMNFADVAAPAGLAALAWN
ncbi:MAG: hypothetical protein H7Z37_18825, partial [Pyrinomonadaceae bacterium]|nr:hypothetical protein [Pyrinomonadaceae bacterium]